MTSRDRILLMVVVGVAVLGCFWFAVLGPKRAEAGRLSAELTKQQERLDTAQASAAGAQRAKDQYVADYAAVARLGKAVPVNANVASLVYQLDSESRGAKIGFDAISVGGGSNGAAAAAAPATAAGTAPALPGGVTSAPFSLTFTGSFFDMESLLARVHSFVTVSNGNVQVSGRLLTINDIQLSAGAQDFSRIQATVSATAFQAAAAAAVPAVAAAGTTATATPASATSTPKAAGTTASSSGSSSASSGSSSSGTATTATTTTANTGTPPPAGNATGTN
jgi:Tfp pilus assembly protein PilO